METRGTKQAGGYHMTRSFRWRGASALVALAAALSSCGGGSASTSGTSAAPTTKGPSSSSTTRPPREGTSVTTTAAVGGASQKRGGEGCDVLSDDVASGVLGVGIVRREPGGDPGTGRYSCLKGTSRSDDPTTFTYVSVGVTPGAGAALLDALGSQEGSQPVTGIGDHAAYLPSAGLLVVSSGGDAVQAQIIKRGVPGGLADAKTVLLDVLERR